MSRPDITVAEIQAVVEVMQGGSLSLGPFADAFEMECAAYTESGFAVSVSSGTAGLHASMIAAGVGRGDLVITTPFSFIASANVILYQGAIPVFVDVEDETGNISPEQAVQATEDISNTRFGSWLPPAESCRKGSLRAILPVHVFGVPADLDPICDVAREHGAAIVEDACEAVGGNYKGRKLGSIGDAGVFAFYPNKQMTTGEGGMVLTRHEEWASVMRSVRNQGRDPGDVWLEHSRLGYNYRLDELSAALGVVQLKRIEELLEKRRRVAGWYTERLSEAPGISLPKRSPFETDASWFVYVIRIMEGIDRTRLTYSLDSVGVPTRPYFRPIHLQDFYRERFGWREGAFPVAEKLGRSSLALPFSSVMTEEEVEHVCVHLLRNV